MLTPESGSWQALISNVFMPILTRGALHSLSDWLARRQRCRQSCRFNRKCTPSRSKIGLVAKTF